MVWKIECQSELLEPACNLPLLVIKGDRQSLFGKNGYTASDLTGRRYSYCSPNNFLHTILQKQGAVLQDGLGWYWMLKGFKVKS